MTCQAIHELLPLFVESDLPRRKTERVRAHLAACAACRGLADEYRQSQQWLHAAPRPTIGGAALEGMRRAVWRRIEREPRPAPLWLAIERGWAALRRWASQPAIAAAAVFLVVLGSVALTRVGGLGGSRLGAQLDIDQEATLVEAANEDLAAAESPEDPESGSFLAAATPEEMAEGSESGDAEPIVEGAASNDMRIEIQTKDPDVRIIWFTPPASEPAAVE
jgi:anti-sigma factor RsiW